MCRTYFFNEQITNILKHVIYTIEQINNIGCTRMVLLQLNKVSIPSKYDRHRFKKLTIPLKTKHKLKLFFIKNYKSIKIEVILLMLPIIDNIIDFSYIYKKITYKTFINFLFYISKLINTDCNNKNAYLKCIPKKQLIIWLLYINKRKNYIGATTTLKLYSFLNCFSVKNIITQLTEFYGIEISTTNLLLMLFSLYKKKKRFFTVFDKFIKIKNTEFHIKFIQYKSAVVTYMTLLQFKQLFQELIDNNVIHSENVDTITAPITINKLSKEKQEIFNSFYMYIKLKRK